MCFLKSPKKNRNNKSSEYACFRQKMFQSGPSICICKSQFFLATIFLKALFFVDILLEWVAVAFSVFYFIILNIFYSDLKYFKLNNIFPYSKMQILFCILLFGKKYFSKIGLLIYIISFSQIKFQDFYLYILEHKATRMYCFMNSTLYLYA